MESLNEHIFKNIEYVIDNFKLFTISVLYHPEHREKSKKMIQFIDENEIQNHSKIALIKKYPDFTSFIDKYNKSDIEYITNKNKE